MLLTQKRTLDRMEKELEMMEATLWDPNLGPSHELYALLTIDPYLKPRFLFKLLSRVNFLYLVNKSPFLDAPKYSKVRLTCSAILFICLFVFQ